MDLVEAERVHEIAHIGHQLVERPAVVRSGIGRLAVAAHIAPNDPIPAGQTGHPVIPEPGAAADAVLQPHRLSIGPPRIR